MTDEKSRAMDEIQRLGQEFDADDLRAKSDALLELCGYEKGNLGADGCWWWRGKDGSVVRWHPQANAQDAIDLAAAMGLRVMEIISRKEDGFYTAALYRDGFQGIIDGDWQPTIAQAICAAIEEAVK